MFTSGAMVVSGGCALTLGWLVDGPVWIVVGVALLWGFVIVADSAQLSAVVTEVAPTNAVGTALTLQTSLGFGLTAVSIWLIVAVTDRFGRGLAFSMLTVGPWLGVVAMMRLKSLRLRLTDYGSERVVKQPATDSALASMDALCARFRSRPRT